VGNAKGAGWTAPGPVARRGRRGTRGLVAAVIVGALVLVGQASGVTPDHTGTVAPATPFTWEGTQATGANLDYSAQTGEPCGKTFQDYCDVTLLNVNVAPSFWDTRGGGVQITINNYTPDAATDFDLYVYKSDANGTRGALVGSSPNVPSLPESRTISNASGYYLVQVVYFAVAASKYGRGEVRHSQQTSAGRGHPGGLPGRARQQSGARLPLALGAAPGAEPGEPEPARSRLEVLHPRSGLTAGIRVQDRYLRLVRQRAHVDRSGAAGSLPARAGPTELVAEQHLLPGRRPEQGRHRR
jgi:hypothetical protein